MLQGALLQIETTKYMFSIAEHSVIIWQQVFTAIRTHGAVILPFPLNDRGLDVPLPCLFLFYAECFYGSSVYMYVCYQVVKVYKAGIQQTLDILFLRGGVTFITSSDCVSRDSADRTLITWDYETTAKVSNQIYHVRYLCMWKRKKK